MSDLPLGWARAKLGDICDVVSGSTPKTGVAEYWGGDIAWLTPDDLSKDRRKVVGGGARTLTQAGYDSCSTRLMPSGAVVFSSRAPVGYVAIAGAPLCTNQGCKSAVPPIGLDPDYLYWYLRWRTPEIESRASGTTFKEVSGRAFAETELLLPPLAEQRRIVEALENHLSRLCAGSALLLSTDRRGSVLAASTLAALWSEAATASAMKRLAEVGRIITGATPSSRTSGNSGSEVMFVTPGDVGNGRMIKSTARMLSAAGAQRSRVAAPGAVLTVCIGATLGKAGWTSAPAAMNQQINAVEPVPSVASGRYLAMMFSSPVFQREMRAAASTTTMPLLNKSRFSTLEVPIPTLDEQASLLSRWDAVHEATIGLRDQSRLARRRAAACRRSLLERAFSGRLIPQQPGDELASVLLERLNAEQAVAPKPARRRTPTSRRNSRS